MLFRSLLFIPASSPKMLLKSNVIKADVIIFDLEDGVSMSRKAEARELLRSYLKSGLTSRTCMVRVNDVHSEEFQKDIDALWDVPFDGLYLPKVEYPEDVQIASNALDRMEKDTEKTVRRCIFNTVETPMGLENSLACLQASSRVAGACLGSEDYAAALGVKRSEDYIELDYARRRLVNIAKATGKKAVDTVFADVENMDGFYKETLYGKRLGYDGKAAVSPIQVPVIHEVFTPTEAEIRHAEAVLAALKEAQKSSKSIALLNGKMIDKPVVDQAKNILEIAKNFR